MNSLMIIHPYREKGIWLFDDEKFSLNGEPLIGGMPEIIEYATNKLNIQNAENGFTTIFSDIPHPGHQFILRWIRNGDGGFGNYYQLEGTELEGWLCPALGNYFPAPPKTIYCTIKQKDN